jgi:hypothetical protein
MAGGSMSSAATPPPAGQKRADYERVFVAAFPAAGSDHQITDWALYTALVTGDLVAYAQVVDPDIAKRAADAKGKPYQTQQVAVRVKGDPDLMAAFNGQRLRLRAMAVYADAGGFAGDKCQLVLTYVGSEFRLVLGEGDGRSDPLSHATIAPSCPSALAPGFQITAGRSSRFKCWPTKYVTRCGWALPDMPAELKGVVESRYPASVSLRWRWRGIKEVVRTRYTDTGGNRVSDHDSVALTVPDALSLAFVDADGHVLWTAPASVPSHKPVGALATRR